MQKNFPDKIAEHEILTFFARGYWGAHFRTVEYCDLKCAHCGGMFGPDKSRDPIKPKYINAITKDFAIDPLCSKSICLSGGEAATIYEKKHNYFHEIYKNAEKCQIATTLKTNGTIAKKPEFKLLMRDLETFPTVRIDISINKFTKNCLKNAIVIVNEMQKRDLPNGINFTFSGYEPNLRLAEKLADGVGKPLIYDAYNRPETIGDYVCRAIENLQDSGRANENGLQGRRKVYEFKDYVECAEYRNKTTYLEFCPNGTVGIMIGFNLYGVVPYLDNRHRVKPLSRILHEMELKLIKEFGIVR